MVMYVGVLGYYLILVSWAQSHGAQLHSEKVGIAFSACNRFYGRK